MKTLIALLLLSTTAFAETQRFICENGHETEFLILEENSATFRGHTLINMMPVDEEMDYRGYSFANDPWESLLVTTPMLQGENGYADLTISDLQTGESQTKGYVCTPAE